MRNPINVLKYLEEKATSKEYRYERLYRNLYNPEFYLLAYRNIAKSQGSMTAGADGMTLDGMSMARINKIIARLKDHSYQPNPARRTYINKKNSSKKRPLGIPSTDDKLVQEIIRMILESIYEPTFSGKSHGFRPNRSCHTALLEIQTYFNGAKWIVEGDIKACFDSFDHHVLIDLLRRRIDDEYFIALMWKFLKAGYLEQWEYHTSYSGTPQGSGMSPVLANIYLSELDTFMEEYKARFDVGTVVRRANPEYSRAQGKYHRRLKKHNDLKAVLSDEERRELVSQIRQLQKERLETPYYPHFCADYKRIQYNRYADDFVVGVIGTKADALKVKEDLKQFLSERLKLTLSEEKTKVTHSSQMVRYLGYDLCVSRSKDYTRSDKGILQRHWYGTVRLYVPHDKWFAKLQEYKVLRIKKDETGKEIWKSVHRGALINRPEVEIVRKFNSEIRGIYNFYRLAHNATVLQKFYHIIKGSLLKTFAAKYTTNCNAIKGKYAKSGVFSVQYVNKAGAQICEFYHDGFARQEDAFLGEVDLLPQYRKYDKTNGLGNRLKKGVCELCGANDNNALVHHTKTMKELTDTTDWERKMKQIRRKSLVVCNACFQRISHSSK